MPEIEVRLGEHKSPDIRVARIKNQREWEENHEVTFEMGILDRASQIRNQIYKGYSKLAGYKPDEVRHEAIDGLWHTERGDIKIEYIHKNFVKEYTEKYAKVIDEIYQEVKKLDRGKSEATTRFVSVMYSVGVTIHPYFDANGQTFRLLSLSYLHELVPETSKLFFPYSSEKTDLFSFNMGLHIPGETPNNEEIGKKMTDMLFNRTTFMLSEEGQSLLKYFVLGNNPEEVSKIISANDPGLQIVGVMRSLNDLGVEMKKYLKNWTVRKSSYYKAIQEKNQRN